MKKAEKYKVLFAIYWQKRSELKSQGLTEWQIKTKLYNLEQKMREEIFLFP